MILGYKKKYKPQTVTKYSLPTIITPIHKNSPLRNVLDRTQSWQRENRHQLPDYLKLSPLDNEHPKNI